MRISSSKRPRLGRALLTGAVIGSLSLAAAGCATTDTPGGGQEVEVDFPSKPIEFIVTTAAGGSMDAIARSVAEGMSPILGQEVVVVNKPGAASALGARETLEATPDGYKLAIVPNSLLTVAPLFVSESEAISLDDIDILTGLTQEDFVLIVNSDSGITTVNELVGQGKRLNYGTAGVGTTQHLLLATLFGIADVESTDIPFDGGAPALTALLGNQVDVVTVEIGQALPYLESGDITALGVFGGQPSPFLPDVPTVQSQGFDIELDVRRFVIAPKGIPQEIRQKLIDAFTASAARPEFDAFLKQRNANKAVQSGEELKALLADILQGNQEAAKLYNIGG